MSKGIACKLKEWLTLWLLVCPLWFHSFSGTSVYFKTLPLADKWNSFIAKGSVMDGKKNRKTTSIVLVQHFCSVCSYRVSALWVLPSNNNPKVSAYYQVLASPWLRVTPPKTLLQRFYLLLQLLLFSSSFPSPSVLAHNISPHRGSWPNTKTAFL